MKENMPGSYSLQYLQTATGKLFIYTFPDIHIGYIFRGEFEDLQCKCTTDKEREAIKNFIATRPDICGTKEGTEPAAPVVRDEAPAAAPVSAELYEARAKLAAREKRQQRMKEVNALIRKHKGNNDILTPLLLEMGEDAHKLLNPTYSYQSKGFQGWEITNNGSEVRRLKDRVKMLEDKESTRAQIASTEGGEQPEEIINGVRIVTDYEADRVQLYFDGKPAREIITELKDHGFKWAPSVMAWQRKLNNAATYQAKRIAGKVTPPANLAPARDEAPAPVGVDLFEDYDQQPEELRAVIEEHREQLESEDYAQLEQALKAVNAIGYTFDYYLDAAPYDLRKIGEKGKTEAANELPPPPAFIDPIC